MKSGFRSQKTGARIRTDFSQRRLTRASGLFLTFVYWFLTPSALCAATHVTGTYDLGSNPKVMATVGGTPEYGLIFAERNKPVNYGGVQYAREVIRGYLDINGILNDGAGNLWLDLIPNTTATPSDGYYVVTVNLQGRVHSEIWIVPDVATVDAAAARQVQPSSPVAPAPFYQFVQQSGNDLPQRLKLNLSGNGLACADNPAELRTDCTISAGAGSQVASATVSGTVKTDSTAPDPVVYLKASADSLLAAKSDTDHGHPESDISNLISDLSGKVPASRVIATDAPLTGGGSLASDVTLSLPASSSSQNGYLSSGDWSVFNSKENPLEFLAPLSRSVDTVSCPTCEGSGNKNASNGYAGLTESTKLNVAQGQEVWSVTDLTDYAAASGSGTTALKTTITAPSDAQCLTWNAASSDWVNGACSGGSSNHNLLSTTHPDTVAASPVLGDVLYANSTPAWTTLAGNATATKKYLAQTGNGTVSAAPAWTQPACGDLSDAAASCSTDTTNASNLSSGTLPSARLPDPTTSAKGGVQAKDCTGTGHVLSINTDSTVTCSADAGGGGGASTGDSFVTISHDADLTSGRTLKAGSAVSLTDGGANGDVTMAWNPLDASIVALREEFCGGAYTSGQVGESGWSIALIGSSGVTLSGQAPAAPNICAARMTTSGTSGRGGQLALSMAGNATPLGNLGGTANWISRFVFRLNTTASVSAYIGFGNTFTSYPPAAFMGIRYDTSATSPGADSAFRFVVCSSSTCTAHATTYTVDSTFHSVQIRAISSGTIGLTFDSNSEICFNSGGTGGCTASANIPSAGVTSYFELVTQTGSAATMDADYFAFMMTGLAR